MRHMLRVALTGGIATGKSYVREQFAALGVPTADADRFAREAVEPGTAALAAIVSRFGPAVLQSDGRLDRRRLGEIVFADAGARRDLEQIVHPVVREASAVWFSGLPPATSVAIYDVPLLFEAAREREFDRIVVAACEPATQLRRLMLRDQLTREQAEARIASQWPLAGKIRRAHHVIHTDGTFPETDRFVREVYEALLADARRIADRGLPTSD